MRVLVVAAHPDDETAGCGGTLLAHGARGDELYWLIVTKAHTPRWEEDVIRAKEAEVSTVADAYRMKEYFWLGLPSTSLDSLPLQEIIEPVRSVIEKIRPEVVYVVNHGDVHTDHRIVADVVTIILKPFYMGRFGTRRILSFESLSSTEAAPPLPDRTFVPTVFHEITPHIERKLHIMGLYRTELQPEGFPRGASAIRALARYRGCTIGVEYAEAFMLLREVW